MDLQHQPDTRDGQPGTAEPGRRGSILQEISNGMVRLYKEQFGRGPTKVRSNFAGPDTLVCLLEDTFTPAERNLAAMGETQRLRDVRLFFQYATEQDFRKVVEEITGRRVVSFISGVDVLTDTAAELFTFEPSRTSADVPDDGLGGGP